MIPRRPVRFERMKLSSGALGCSIARCDWVDRLAQRKQVAGAPGGRRFRPHDSSDPHALTVESFRRPGLRAPSIGAFLTTDSDVSRWGAAGLIDALHVKSAAKGTALRPLQTVSWALPPMGRVDAFLATEI